MLVKKMSSGLDYLKGVLCNSTLSKPILNDSNVHVVPSFLIYSSIMCHLGSCQKKNRFFYVLQQSPPTVQS